MLSSHRIPVLTRAHSIVLPEHLPEISDIGEPRVIRDFRYRTVFFPEQLCRILQPHGADIVSRGMAGERLQLVEKSGAAHVLHATVIISANRYHFYHSNSTISITQSVPKLSVNQYHS